MTHPGKLCDPRSFIERALDIANKAWHISSNGGPHVFVDFCPHVRAIYVYAYEPKWTTGADITWTMNANERRDPANLGAIEARLNALMEQVA